MLGCSRKKQSPKLVVIISVDQMRGDYLSEFKNNFSKGLSHLVEHGIVFTDAHHHHFNTTTAAGHASISTGYYPANNGITSNSIYLRDQKRKAYCIEDTSVTFVGADSFVLQKVSPLNLVKPSIGDIVREQNFLSKSFSVALKDRSSVLMGGQSPNRCFWFNASSTTMVSTDYYKSPYPNWAQSFNAASILNEDLKNGWHLEESFSPVSSTTADSIIYEKGRFYVTFPHTIPTFDSSLVTIHKEGAFFWNTPFGDKYVLEFSKKLIQNENLGMDSNIDVLTIGLSAADIIGHHFGPNSYEVLDYYSKFGCIFRRFYKLS